MANYDENGHSILAEDTFIPGDWEAGGAEDETYFRTSSLFSSDLQASLAGLASSLNLPPSSYGYSGSNANKTPNPSPPDDNPPRHSPPYISPFLGLTAKFTRAYATNGILAVFLVGSLLLTAFTLLQDRADETKEKLAASCANMEAVGNTITSLPHYTTTAINTMATSSITVILNHLSSALAMIIYVIKLLVFRQIRRYQRVYLCLLSTVVSGITNAVSTHATEITTFIQHQMNDVSGALNVALDGINQEFRALNSISQAGVNVVNRVVHTFDAVLGGGGGSGITFKPFSLPQVTARLSFQLPVDFTRMLQRANSTIPSLAQVDAAIEGLISPVFDQLTREVTDQVNGIVANTHAKLAIVPRLPSTAPLQFCKDVLDVGWVDQLLEAFTVCLGMLLFWLVLAGIIMIVWNAISIAYEHGKEERQVERVVGMLESTKALEVDKPYMPVSDQARYLISEIGDLSTHSMVHGTAERISPRQERLQHRIVWFLRYISHPESWVFMLIGAVGLSAIILQYFLLAEMEKNALPVITEHAAAGVDDAAVRVMAAINTAIDPEVLAINARIVELETTLNQTVFQVFDKIFGSIDGAIQRIVSELNSVLTTVFNDVPIIKKAIMSYITCVLGINLSTVETISADIHRFIGTYSLPKVNRSMYGLGKEDVLQLLQTTGGVPLGNTSKTENVFGKHVQSVMQAYKRFLSGMVRVFTIIAAFGLSIVVLGLIGAVFQR